MMSDFLPNMRGLVSHELHEAGESQRRIAIMLGITQARVSYYLGKRKSTFATGLIEKFGISLNDLQSYSKILAEDVKRSQVDGIFTLYSIWKHFLFSGAICAAHQRESGVSPECAVCMELQKPARESVPSSDQEAEDMYILRDISQAVSLIEGSVHFPDLMPEVSVNVAMSRSNPQSTRDVAAVPGRINKIHNRAKSFVLPEFGCSRHMSQVLLIFCSKNKKFRAGMNIKWDNSVGKVLDELNIPKVSTSFLVGRSAEATAFEASGDPVLQRLAACRIPDNFRASVLAVADKGSEGVEPMTYLLGQSATELAGAAVKIAHMYANLSP
jgi:XRE family transcriptional regulator, thiamine biosynthesis regulator